MTARLAFDCEPGGLLDRSPLFDVSSCFTAGQEVFVGGCLPPIECSGDKLHLSVPYQSIGCFRPGRYRIEVRVESRDQVPPSSAPQPVCDAKYSGRFSVREAIECSEFDIQEVPFNDSGVQVPGDDELWDMLGTVYFPLAPGSGEPFVAPVVVVTNGQLGSTTTKVEGYPVFRWYDYLLKCLAHNGFIAIGAESFGDPARRARFLIALLYHAKTKAAELQKPLELSGVEVAFIGHSQGGEAAVEAARRVAAGDGPTGLQQAKNAIALAPSHNIVGVPGPDLPADFGYLNVSGNRDDDVELGAAHEFNEIDASIAYRGMLFLEGGTHHGFVDAEAEPTFSGTFGPSQFAFDSGGAWAPDKQNQIVREFVVAFLRWRILNDANQSGLLRGDEVPKLGKYTYTGEARLLYREGPFAPIGLLGCGTNDDECSILSPFVNSSGAGLSVPKFIGSLHAVDKSYIIDEGGYVLRWSGNLVSPYRAFFLAPENWVWSLDDAVEFDIGRVAEGGFQQQPFTFDMALLSSKTTVYRRDVLVLAPEQLISPDAVTASIMSTRRFPLSSFPGITQSFVDELVGVLFDFGTASVGSARVLLSMPRRAKA